MTKISHISALEILDSRGNPTVEAKIELASGITARAAVPSGASTGVNEALELRDGGKRYGGKGVQQAVKNVNQIIAPALKNFNVVQQQNIDQKMLELDGTDNKNKLGANAMLAVSIAAVKTAAKTQNKPTYQYVAELFGQSTDNYTLPVPMMNVLNGGKHASGSTDMQEYMIMPVGAPSLKEAVRWGAETFHTLGKILKTQDKRTTVGDEGGYAPQFISNEEPLELIVAAIQEAGYQPGKEIAIALDPAATEFYHGGQYELQTEGKTLNSEQLVKRYQYWVDNYPIVSIEDGLAEDDWSGFALQTKEMGEKVQIVGDDLFVTNSKFLKKGIELGATNSILIKLNQIGTVSETLKTIRLALDHDMTTVVSHRSGETEDPFIADFAVGTGVGQIKTGSLSRSDRIAKYNQLMRIEAELGSKASFADFPYAQ